MKWLHGCILCCFSMLGIIPHLGIFKSVASANAIHFNSELISCSSNPPVSYSSSWQCMEVSGAHSDELPWVSLCFYRKACCANTLQKCENLNRTWEILISSRSHFTPPPPSGMQSKWSGSVSGMGYGCQLPWVAGLKLATVNEWGWTENHSERKSLGEEEARRSRLLTQRSKRSPVKHLDTNLSSAGDRATLSKEWESQVHKSPTFGLKKRKVLFFFSVVQMFKTHYEF